MSLSFDDLFKRNNLTTFCNKIFGLNDTNEFVLTTGDSILVDSISVKPSWKPDEWEYTKSVAWKSTDQNMANNLKEYLESLQDERLLLKESSGKSHYSVRLTLSGNKIGKSQYVSVLLNKIKKTKEFGSSGGGKVPAAIMTAMQELGSAWIFKRAIVDNKTWSNWREIIEDDETMKELKNIWKVKGKQDTIETEWIENFYIQNKTLIAEIGKPKYTEFNRETGYSLPGMRTSPPTFMDWISELVRDYAGISKKDNWNPADIWLIKNEDKHRKTIMDVLSGNKKGNSKQNLLEINMIMRTLFKEHEIFGISLKKVSGKQAKIEFVNHKEDFFKNLESLTFITDSMSCPLDLEIKNKIQTFSTQDSRIIVKNGSRAEYNFQIKANDSTKFTGLKFEPTAKGAAAARLGKATVELVLGLLKDHGINNFNKSPNDYPKSLKEFNDKKLVYQKYLTEMKKNGVDFRVSSVKEMIENIALVFTTQPHVANSKLMQITFVYHYATLSNDERDELGTDMVFSAMKMGRNYGPFAKIY